MPSVNNKSLPLDSEPKACNRIPCCHSVCIPHLDMPMPVHTQSFLPKLICVQLLGGSNPSNHLFQHALDPFCCHYPPCHSLVMLVMLYRGVLAREGSS